MHASPFRCSAQRRDVTLTAKRWGEVPRNLGPMWVQKRPNTG